MHTTIGFATIGTSKITQKFLSAAKECEGFKLVAVYSRDIKKAEQFAGEQGAERFYDSLDMLVADKDVEAVYVASPNYMHYKHVMKLLKAGKHVFCEKAIASNHAEAEEMFRTAQERHLVLLEAVRPVFDPGMQAIKNNLYKLGAIRKANISYCQYSSRYDQYRKGEVLPAFDPASSGGSLMDINIYNLHFTAGLFGMPEKIHYYPRIGFNGIDTSGTAVLEYPDFHAVLSGAKDSESPGYAVIQGEDGYIRVNGIPSQVAELTVFAGGVTRTFTKNQKRHRMVDEMLEFDRILTEDDRETADRLLEHSLTVMKLLEAARKDGGIHFPADEG